MRRAVFDSTVLVSGFLRPGGVSDELLSLAAADVFELVLAPDIIAETERKLLTSARIRRRYLYDDDRVDRFCRGLSCLSELVRDPPPVAAVARDPSDDIVVACAIAGQARCIVTRDKDLLSLGSFRQIAMIPPETFRQQLRKRASAID
jgi:uncharacterized protein